MRIAQVVEVQYQVVGQPLLTIQEAIRAGSFFGKGPGVLTVGDAKGSTLCHTIRYFILCMVSFRGAPRFLVRAS